VDVSRRTLLKVTASGLVVAGFDIIVSPANAHAATRAASTPVPPALTTLDATVVPGDAGLGGYRPLAIGSGEPHVVRSELTDAMTGVTNVVAAFAQMTDLHIVDDQSPARTEFFDYLADPGPPHFGSYPFGAAYRPQESMSTQVVDAMCRAIAREPVGRSV
jgi:hypothetical protein